MISSDAKVPRVWPEEAQVPDGTYNECERNYSDQTKALNAETVAALRKMTAERVYECIVEETMLGGGPTMIQKEAINAAYLGCVLRYMPHTRAH